MALLPACGGLGNSYVVQVDPSFTADEQAEVLAALDSWEAAVPVHFTAVVASCSGISAGIICTHASNHAEIEARQSVSDGVGIGLTLREQSWGHVVDGGEVFVDVPTIEASYTEDFQRLVAHEIGHAMQLEHDGRGNLMAAMATDDAPTPTCVDAGEWYAVRDEQPPSCAH